MSDRLIRINTDDPQRIAKLAGIRLRLANRIVAERARSGYFQSNIDLRRVKGLNTKFLSDLEARIDWSLPQQENISRSPSLRAAVIFATLILFLFGFTTYSTYIYAWPTLKLCLNSPSVTVRVSGLVRFVSSVSGSVFLLTGFCAWGASLGGQNGVRAAYAKSARVFFKAFLVTILALGISNLLIYRSESGGLIAGLRDNPHGAAGLASFLLLLIIIVPVVAGWLYPRVAAQQRIASAYRLGALCFTILSAVILGRFTYPAEARFPIAFRLLHAILALFIVVTGIGAIVASKSLYLLLEQQFLQLMHSPNPNVRNWMAWLNVRVPDPREQRELMEALQETYRRSLTGRLPEILVVGVGGWIVVTSLAAILQWLIQKLLVR